MAKAGGNISEAVHEICLRQQCAPCVCVQRCHWVSSSVLDCTSQRRVIDHRTRSIHECDPCRAACSGLRAASQCRGPGLQDCGGVLCGHESSGLWSHPTGRLLDTRRRGAGCDPGRPSRGSERTSGDLGLDLRIVQEKQNVRAEERQSGVSHGPVARDCGRPCDSAPERSCCPRDWLQACGREGNERRRCEAS